MSPTAIEAAKEQAGQLVDPSIYERGAELVNVQHFLLDVVKSNNLDIDVGASITSGYIERTMDGASTLNVVVHDQRNVLLESGIFGDGTESHFPAIDVRFDGLWFRLVQISKSGPDITLVFEDRIVALLRLKRGSRKASRGNMTRAQFIRMLVREVKSVSIRFYSPELDKKQAIAKPQKTVTRRNKRSAGLLKTTDLQIDGSNMTRTQLENAEQVLDAGAAKGANTKVLIVSMMVVAQESRFSNAATNGTHVGLFQQDPKYWPATRDATKDANAFYDRAIKMDRANPGQSLTALAESVQHSGQPSKYTPWTKFATKLVKEYGDNGGNVSAGTRNHLKNYEFHRGAPDGPKNENTWDCTKRLADEVNWRRFVVGNTFYYIQDKDLMIQRPIDTIWENMADIDSIDFDMDAGKHVSEGTVTCRADRWYAHPGEIVIVKNAGPANGRWLVWTINRDLFSTKCTITIRQPEVAKKEPAPEVVQESIGDGSAGYASGGRIKGGKARDRIVAAAELALSYGSKKYSYLESRPMHKSLFQKGHIALDCSEFATLVYKAAGVIDPNGFGYNGSGNTSTLIANGHNRKPSNLQPGDLVFYSNPEHVGVYIGDGDVIECGGNPCPKKVPVNYRTPTHYKYYDLLADQSYDDHNSYRPINEGGKKTG